MAFGELDTESGIFLFEVISFFRSSALVRLANNVATSSALGSLTFCNDQCQQKAKHLQPQDTHGYFGEEDFDKGIVFSEVPQNLFVRRKIDKNCQSIFRNFLCGCRSTLANVLSFHSQFPILEPGNSQCNRGPKVADLALVKADGVWTSWAGQLRNQQDCHMLRKGIYCQHKVRTKICQVEKLSWFRITDLSYLSIAMVKKFDQLHNWDDVS